jgi:transcription initiation factor TFIIF subunit beta
MERWSAIDAEDVHLATIRVYNEAVGPSGRKPRIVLFLPPNSADPSTPDSTPSDPNRPTFSTPTSYASTGPEPDSYELDMVNDAVNNQIVVADRSKDSLPSAEPGPINPRARTTILTGRIKHDCNLRPMFTDSYRKQMKERSRRYNTPRRQIMRIEEAGVSGGRGGINRLSSGVGVGAGNAFGDLIVSQLLVIVP